MDGGFQSAPVAGVGGSPPSEAWLVAQQLLGKPIPNSAAAAAEARRDREHLEWLAQISTRHEAELRRLRGEEADARRRREQLEWLAKISTRHKSELRKLQRVEAEAHDAAARSHAFQESVNVQEADWDPAKHPRGSFPQNPGWFSPTGGSSGTNATTTRTSPIHNTPFRPGQMTPHVALASAPAAAQSQATASREPAPSNAHLLGPSEQGANPNHVITRWPNGTTERGAQPGMVKLALGWYRAKRMLDQCREDIKKLPAINALIQKFRALGPQTRIDPRLFELRRQLTASQSLIPVLEELLVELKNDYRDRGYEHVYYKTMTASGAFTDGVGIESVGPAVAAANSEAGIQKTNVELDLPGLISVFRQLGKAALKRALAKSSSQITDEAAALRPYNLGGGHHIPARKAFEGAVGYDAKTALAIPKDELAALGVQHSKITGAQRALYGQFARTGAPLTWEAMEKIETEALVRAGVDSAVAGATVKRAIEVLQRAGMSGPTRIPWRK